MGTDFGVDRRVGEVGSLAQVLRTTSVSSCKATGLRIPDGDDRLARDLRDQDTIPPVLVKALKKVDFPTLGRPGSALSECLGRRQRRRTHDANLEVVAGASEEDLLLRGFLLLGGHLFLRVRRGGGGEETRGVDGKECTDLAPTAKKSINLDHVAWMRKGKWRDPENFAGNWGFIRPTRPEPGPTTRERFHVSLS